MIQREIDLHICGIDEAITFRVLNLSDENYIQSSYPDFADRCGGSCVDLMMFADILFRQMKSSQFESSDEFCRAIIGDQAKADLIDCFTQVCALSRPKITAADVKELKKKKKTKQMVFSASLALSLLAIIGLILKFAV